MREWVRELELQVNFLPSYIFSKTTVSVSCPWKMACRVHSEWKKKMLFFPLNWVRKETNTVEDAQRCTAFSLSCLYVWMYVRVALFLLKIFRVFEISKFSSSFIFHPYNFLYTTYKREREKERKKERRKWKGIEGEFKYEATEPSDIQTLIVCVYIQIYT